MSDLKGQKAINSIGFTILVLLASFGKRHLEMNEREMFLKVLDEKLKRCHAEFTLVQVSSRLEDWEEDIPSSMLKPAYVLEESASALGYDIGGDSSSDGWTNEEDNGNVAASKLATSPASKPAC